MVTIQGKQYLSDFEAKKAILDIGKRMYMRGFVAANDGNISCRVGPNAIWTTPTGVSKGFMTQDMLVKINLDGKVLVGNRKPSSEGKMHLRVYRENGEAMAVTHAHPPVATSFSIAGISLDNPILAEAVVQLGSVPIAPYATPGSQEVPDSIAPYCKTHNGVLLANHGALTWGRDPYEAFYRLESIEHYATILMYTGNIIGRQNPLSCNQVEELLDIRKKLGISNGGTPICENTKTDRQAAVSPGEPVLKGVTGLVRPGGGNTGEAAGCGCGGSSVIAGDADAMRKTKEEIIAEVVRRVTEQINS